MTYNGVSNVAASNSMFPALFGVVEGGLFTRNANGTFTTGGAQWGVALTNADVTWINSTCATFMMGVPEPSTWVLFAIGLSGAFVATRRSRSKAGAEGRT
jgi:hypothetical protein